MRILVACERAAIAQRSHDSITRTISPKPSAKRVAGAKSAVSRAIKKVCEAVDDLRHERGYN